MKIFDKIWNLFNPINKNICESCKKEFKNTNKGQSKGMFTEEFYEKYGTAKEARKYINNNLEFTTNDPKVKERLRKERIRKLWFDGC